MHREHSKNNDRIRDLRFCRLDFQMISYYLVAFAALAFMSGQVAAGTDEISVDRPIFEVQPVQENIRELKPGETIERQMAAGETQSYEIRLEAGQSVTVKILKHSMAINVETRLPTGEQYFVDQRPSNLFMAPTVIVAEVAGSYRINVRSFWSGSYALNSSVPHVTTEKDKKYQSAQRLYLDWLKLTPSSVEKGIQALLERIAVCRSIDDPEMVAVSLTDAARQYHSMGEYSKMLDSYSEALQIFTHLDGVADIKVILNILSYDAAQRKGNFQEALDYANKLLDLSRSKSDRYGVASSLLLVGIIYHLLGDEQKAIDFYTQATAGFRSVDPPTIEALFGAATSLGNTGNLYRGVGGDDKILAFFSQRTTNDRQKAIEYYKQVLEIYRDAVYVKGLNSASLAEARTLLNIGNSYKELGNYPEALNYFEQSLTINKDLKSRRQQVNVLRSIGNLYSLKGEFQKSSEYDSQAVDLLKGGVDNGNQTEFLNGIAADYYRAGETQKALDLYSESLTLSRAREQHVIAANSLFEIARIERDQGNFNNARNRIEEAIQIAESVRAKSTSEDLRTSYFSTVKRFYDFYIDLLMQAHKAQPEKGFDALALQMSEKGRSRSLLDLLALYRVDIKQGIDPVLLERERTIRQQLSDKASHQSRLLLTKHTEEEAATLGREVSKLNDEYANIQAEIRTKSPRYAALTQPTSLNAKQIQHLQDPGTVLLEYSLGEKKSYLWAITPASIVSFDLPGREEIETRARKVYELITARNMQIKGETEEKRRVRIKLADAEYPKAASDLAETLLGPAASQIKNKRLAIVPDGALNYVSFAALPSPKAEEVIGAGQLALGVNHEVVTLPSASTLSRLRDEVAAREPAPKMLAVFADPVFNEVDTRAAVAGKRPVKSLAVNAKTGSSAGSRDFERAISDVGLSAVGTGGLARLPFSRREADSIFSVSPKNLSMKRTDFDASKQEVFKPGLDQYRILHFATHGLLNSQHPELSGVVLSLVNKDRSEIDGFLRLQDIYNLKLNADLVVLSACNTALGKEVKGEGLIGLTRGFMYAGAPRVVASLWKVDDAATAELMSIFYRKMLVENLRPAAALRAAQNELMKQPRWRSPYYWAPFVLQGEWK